MLRPRNRRADRPRAAIRGDEDLSELLTRAAAGERAAEEVFVARTIDDVWRYCRYAVGPSHADDATQATYIRALRSLGNFRAESSAKTWIIGVARNTCLDLQRSIARTYRLEQRLLTQPVAVVDELYAEAVPVEMEDLLGGLSEDRREAFVLTQVLGFSYDAAAELAGVPIGTIRSRVARARADLADQLRGAERAERSDEASS
jgi:RNA polymerase sigma-70 factor (ECF subfamily)